MASGASVKPWPKSTIKQLQQTITSFWVCNRPLGMAGLDDFNARFDRVLAERRQDIVVYELEDHVRISKRREEDNKRTAEHYGSAKWCAGTPHGVEMVERYTKFAKEEGLARARLEKLIERVKTEGLPPEVVNFDPRGKAP